MVRLPMRFMGEEDFRVLVAAIRQPFDVTSQRLPAAFVMVQNPNVLVYKLDNPDHEGVGVGARAANRREGSPF